MNRGAGMNAPQFRHRPPSKAPPPQPGHPTPTGHALRRADDIPGNKDRFPFMAIRDHPFARKSLLRRANPQPLHFANSDGIGWIPKFAKHVFKAARM